MRYIQETKYYTDLYDLITINACLRILSVGQKMLKEKRLKKRQTLQEYESEVAKTIHFMLLFEEVERYQKRESTISEWLDRDSVIQQRFDSAICPKLRCEKCNNLMKEAYKDFEGTDYTSAPVIFTIVCKSCHIIKKVYEDGREYIRKPERCPKCNGIVKSNWTTKSDISKHTVTCTKCDYKEVTSHNEKEWKQKWEEEKRQDNLKLRKYRSEFCIEGKDAEDKVLAVEHYRLAQEVYDYELSLYDDPSKAEAFNTKKIDINELEKLLQEKIVTSGYKSLQLAPAEVDKFVIVPFTIQESVSRHNKRESEREFIQLVTSTLKDTNWRLMKDSVTYRLGFISGSLKGYERDEDLQKLFGSTPVKKQPKEIDPERMAKYGEGGRGMVGLAKLFARMEGEERMRAKKLKDHPEGYFLEDSYDKWYICGICGKSIKSKDTWWDLNGKRCADCQRNIKGGVIPASLLKDRDEWFSDKTIYSQFGIRSNTATKMIQNNELIGCELTDTNGRIYLTVFIKDENESFLKAHPQKKFEMDTTFVDSEGKQFKL